MSTNQQYVIATNAIKATVPPRSAQSSRGRELGRTAFTRAVAYFNQLSDALRAQHEQLLRARQSRELLQGVPLQSVNGTPA